MIQIQTRQNRTGKWWCNATIKGYDHSFKGLTKDAPQFQMRYHLSKPAYKELKFEWLPAVYYEHNPMERYKEPFKRTWIDHKPFA